jgi:hypothetical protein
VEPPEPPAGDTTLASPAPNITAREPIQTESSPDNNGLSLAENDGFIVPPAAPIPALNLDLSGLSALAEFDQPLEAPKDDSIPELDLSSMSVKDNDGSPLVEPAPDVAPSVTPPNFDLDAPGALLETIGLPEPVAMPDLSALSVRASEGDLLESHERQDAAPVIVDTSRLTVLENT